MKKDGFNTKLCVLKNDVEVFLKELEKYYEILKIEEEILKNETYKCLLLLLKEKFIVTKEQLEEIFTKYEVLSFVTILVKNSNLEFTTFYAFTDKGVKRENREINEVSLTKAETLLDVSNALPPLLF